MTIVYDANDFTQRPQGGGSCSSCSSPRGSLDSSEASVLDAGPYAELVAGRDQSPARLAGVFAMLRGPMPGDADYVVPGSPQQPEPSPSPAPASTYDAPTVALGLGALLLAGLGFWYVVK